MTDDTQISEREREILRLVATGATNQQIAQQLNISVNTVKVHVRNIYEKIGVVSRAEATLYAVRSGLVSVERAGGQVAVAEEPGGSEPEAAVEAPPEEPRAAPVLLAPPPADPHPAAAPVEGPRAELAQAEPAAAPTPSEPASPGVTRPVPAAVRPRLPLLLIIGAVATLAVAAVGLLLLRPPPVASPEATAGPGQAATSERLRQLASLPAPRAGFALAGAAFEGRQYLYVIGGEDDTGVRSDTLRYDISADVWVGFSPKPEPVSDVRAAVVGNRVFVPGGRRADGTISDALEAYDPQRDRWESLAPLPAPRSRYALAAVEGKVYLFGGWDGSEYRAEVFQYSPDADSWATLTAMPAARADAGAVEVDNQVYVLGGADASGPLALNNRYNPAEEGVGNPWSIGAPLPGPRALAGVAEANNFVFVVGGEGGPEPLLSYSPSLDAWAPFDIATGAGRSDLRAYAQGVRLYIIGGRLDGAVSADLFEYQALYVLQVPEA